MIDRFELKNFTAFTDLELNFSSKINVIIGENGTGKTHLLKAAYALCTGVSLLQDNPDFAEDTFERALTAKLLRLFMPLEDRLGNLRRLGVAGNAHMNAFFTTGNEISLSFHTNSKKIALQSSKNIENEQSAALFIPTKEVLSLVKGMNDERHDQATVDLIFDDGYIDIARALMKAGDENAEAQLNLDPRLYAIIPQLVNLIGGRYQWEDGGFCFQAGKYVDKKSPKRTKAKAAQMYQDSTVTEFLATSNRLYSSGMTAEGYRKVGILHRLLSNGTISPGTSGPLFWDEPESNMNPILMKNLVEIILELSRNGQQIVLGTHDYVLLKWLDLLADAGQGDHVCYHCLYLDKESNELDIETTEDYNSVSKSAISNTFAELYDADVKRALG